MDKMEKNKISHGWVKKRVRHSTKEQSLRLVHQIMSQSPFSLGIQVMVAGPSYNLFSRMKNKEKFGKHQLLKDERDAEQDSTQEERRHFNRKCCTAEEIGVL